MNVSLKKILLIITSLLFITAFGKKEKPKKVEVFIKQDDSFVVTNEVYMEAKKNQVSLIPEYIQDEVCIWKEGFLPFPIKGDSIPTDLIELIKPEKKFDFNKEYSSLNFSKFFTSKAEFIVSDYTDIVSTELKTSLPNIQVPNIAFNNNTSNSRYQLAGEVIKANLIKYFKSGVSVTTGIKNPGALVEVKWTLYDNKSRKIVYEKNHFGIDVANISVTDADYIFKTKLKTAIKLCTISLLSDSNFEHILTNNGSDPFNGVSKLSKDLISIPLVQNQDLSSKSEIIKNAIESAVTIKTNSGHGSGFFISEDGMILTNHHVVENANRVTVIMKNGLELEAEVKFFDEKRDVAIIDIAGKGHSALSINQKDVSVGEEVCAIGTPENINLGQSVSSGIISGKRGFESQIFLQTDASINPGNSGGPLVDSKGNVVGIVVSKRAGSYDYFAEGIAFAIPIMDALKVLNIELE